MHADVASETASGRHHAGFNFDFLRFAVHLLDDAVNLRQNRGNVGDDQRVGALVGHHIATLTEEFLDRQQHVLGMGIAEEACDADFVHRERLGIDLGAPVLGFPLQRIDRGDAKDVAVQLTGQVVVLEHDVQRLIPGHVIEHDGQGAVDHGIEYDVQTANLVNQAEEVFQIHILEVHGDGFASVLGPSLRRLLFQLDLLLGGQVHGRRDGWRVAGSLPEVGIDIGGDQFCRRLVSEAARRFLGLRGRLGGFVVLHRILGLDEGKLRGFLGVLCQGRSGRDRCCRSRASPSERRAP